MASLGDSVRKWHLTHWKTRFALIRRGATIDIAGFTYTFKSDIGARVEEGILLPQDAPTPSCLIDEIEEEPDNETSMSFSLDRKLGLVVQGVDEYHGEDVGDFSRDMLADIQVIIGHRDSRKFTAPVSASATQVLDLRIKEVKNVVNGGGLLGGRAYVHVGLASIYITSTQNPMIAQPA